ncbi:MAG: Flp pilus assembly complex ATPase component TadA [Phycisphaerales bacterium]|nr:Flp pilus assembly complex ATPase component TadA [Phycisphaerales bacterium]MCI0675883.1 Flp pilus assembly complex ATPase component TadA [Phycisphaerales bacterium]
MIIELTFAQSVSGSLVSWYQALLILAPFVAWGWLVATKLEKDARFYHLKHERWNSIHLAAAFAALAVMLLVPWFLLGWPVGILLLLAPILVYWRVRNAAVPEAQRYHLSSDSFGNKLAARRQARAAKQALLQFVDSNGRTRSTPLKDEPLFPVHMLAEDVVGPALAARASRIEMEVGPSGTAVMQTIDGVRYKRAAVPTDISMRMIDYLKDIAGLDAADRRRRQAGAFVLKGPGGETQINIITNGSSTGQRVRIDFEREKRMHKPFDGIGLLAPQLEALRAFEQPHERHGVILIGAPTGHGLTTTAYSFLSRHDAYTSNVKTLEREVMVQLLGVDQTQWDPTNPDIDYATNLQSILRRDPDIVLTADVRDQDTARVITEPGMKGPLIYVQQPLPTIDDQIRDWFKKVGDGKNAIKALRAVVNQRLLRTLCPNCRQAYQPTPEQLKKLNLPPKKGGQLYRASGKVQVKNKIEDCPVCGGHGYLGQTGVFEVMIVDAEVRKHLGALDLKSARAHARRQNMIYLQEAALSKVITGETDIEEVVRATSAGRPAQAGAAPTASAGSPASGAAAKPPGGPAAVSKQPSPAGG